MIKCECGHEFNLERQMAHYLMCGDSTSTENVGRLMADEKAALFATDPPYGIAYGVETGASIKYEAIANDDKMVRDYRDFWNYASGLGCPIYGRMPLGIYGMPK